MCDNTSQLSPPANHGISEENKNDDLQWYE